MSIIPHFSKHLHRQSKDISDNGRVHISADMSEWPREWKTVSYKRYEHTPHLALPLAPLPPHSFAELIQERRSTRAFSGNPISLAALSGILQCSGGLVSKESGSFHRAQPSGGARYPLEIYPLVLRSSEELRSGVYHYDVKNHALDTLHTRPFTREDLARLFVYEWVQYAALALVITAIFERSSRKYGERAYRHISLEAGHIGQNVYLASGALGLGCCSMGGERDLALEELLQIDGTAESVLYVLVVGESA